MTSAIDEFFVKSEVCYHHVICNMTFYCELPTAVDFIEHFSLYISFLIIIISLIPIWCKYFKCIYSISSCIMRLDKILFSIAIKTKYLIKRFVSKIAPYHYYKYWYKSKIKNGQLFCCRFDVLKINSGKNTSSGKPNFKSPSS